MANPNQGQSVTIEIAKIREYCVGLTARGDEIRVVYRGRDYCGTDTHWAVMRSSWRLSRGGQWAFEMQPSSRTARWIKAHSWPTFDEAYTAALRKVAN